MKKLAGDAFIVGCALFAMFFGAGNVIFPPYVGLAAGPQWLSGFICYYIADVGLALVAVFAMLRANCIDRVEGIAHRLGDIPAKLMMASVVLCIGPLLAMPRTGATTFSMAVVPFAGMDALWLQIIFTIIYFGTVLVFSIRESALVDIVGRYLTPMLVLGLLAMILMGAINPIGPVSDAPKIENITWMGISYGYQTLDVMAIMIFGLIVVNALKAKGYTSEKRKFLSVGFASIVAGLLLFVVYGGLCYLGATVSTMYPENIDKGLLAISIAGHIFGAAGSAVMSLIVGLACLTTAIALAGSAGTFFSTLSNGRVSYATVVTITCAFSAFVATFGLNNIIAIAGPILTFLYPGTLTVVMLSLFDSQIRNDNVFRFATLGALAASFCDVMVGYFPGTFAFITILPFQTAGFGWTIPALLAGIIGSLFKPRPGAKSCLPSEAK